MWTCWGDEGFYGLNTGFEGGVDRREVLCFARFAGKELGYCELGWEGWEAFYSPWVDLPGDFLCCRRHDIAAPGIVYRRRGLLGRVKKRNFGAR